MSSVQHRNHLYLSWSVMESFRVKWRNFCAKPHGNETRQENQDDDEEQ